jgi:hypothetical protein
MTDSRRLIEAIAKHLPPSAATLRLMDVGGAVGATLAGLRGDLQVMPVPDLPASISPNSVDAVVAYDVALSQEFLSAALAGLRPGGRLIIVNPAGVVSATWVKTLEDTGYVRILVEPASNPGGVLIRGEKPHTEQRTPDRIQQVAGRDANLLDLASYTGRYIHLLIRQSPNKPVWKLAPGEQVEWHAVALANNGAPALLAFSSLPKAVAFMQPTVLSGRIKDVNKVAKFSRETAQQWASPVILNPTPEALEGCVVLFMPVDSRTAEAPDE